MEIEDDENLSLYSSAIPGGSKLEKNPHEIIEEIAATTTTESEKIEGEVGEDDDQIVPEIKEWIRVEHNPTPFVLMSQPEEEEDSEDEFDQEENWRIDHSNDILFYCEDSSDDDEDTIQLEMFEVQHQLWMFEDSSESDVEE